MISQLNVGGLTPLSTTDYPGMLAAVVFCQGCPWRCGPCHNPHLLPRENPGGVEWTQVMNFLQRRRGLLDAVVFSGGEPTLQKELLGAIQEVKELGYKVGLHTCGAYPDRLAQILPHLDWVGMDIKVRWEDYSWFTATPGSGERARESAKLLLESGVAHEFRTTVHPALISRESLRALAEDLVKIGVRRYVLQEFRPAGCTNTELTNTATPNYLAPDFCNAIGSRFEFFAVRPA